jgi:hypothetical protein
VRTDVDATERVEVPTHPTKGSGIEGDRWWGPEQIGEVCNAGGVSNQPPHEAPREEKRTSIREDEHHDSTPPSYATQLAKGSALIRSIRDVIDGVRRVRGVEGLVPEGQRAHVGPYHAKGDAHLLELGSADPEPRRREVDAGIPTTKIEQGELWLSTPTALK